MENLTIEQTKFTPEVILDASEHRMTLRGESYPENTGAFYEPVFQWLKTYLAELENQVFTVEFDLIYFNSSSLKALMNLLDELNEATQQGKQVVVNWYYDEEDDNSLENGEEFKDMLEDLTFNLVVKQDG